MIPESFIEELKYRSEIEQTISSYVNLKRNGRLYKGVCPFHSEKSPSFFVYPDSQSFYCFGCGAGGDVVTFIKKIENLEYVEALKFLAQRNGLTFPEEGVDDSAAKLKQEILAINRDAARFYHNQLKSENGKKALEYLIDRGLSGKTIGSFGIGYATDNWDNLRNHLRAKGYSDYAITSANLVSKSKKESYYDVFRNRIIFPIIDLRGNVIAFGGRIMGDGGPKYLNSSDTVVFKKSRNLFALNFAKNSKEQSIILAEGYMDVISLHQAGFVNAVATLGTALTSEQARVIATYSQEVLIAYDSDEAGQKATQRAIRLLEETGVKIKVIAINDAKDPDEYIKKFGATRFKLLLEGSAGSTDYEIEKLKSKYNVATNEGKVNFLKEFSNYIAQMQSPVERDVYISKIASELGVEKEALKEQTVSAVKKREKLKKYSEDKSLKLYTEQAPNNKRDFNRSKNIKYAIAEDKLLAHLVKNPDYFKGLKDKISPEDFITDSNRAIFSVIYARLLNGNNADMISLATELSEEQISHLSYILAQQSGMAASLEETLECVKAIKSFDRLKEPENILSSSNDDILKYIQGLKK